MSRDLVLSEKDLLKEHPWISDGEHGDTCIRCMTKTCKAQLAHAEPLIRKDEREKLTNELEAIDRDADDVRDFTQRVCALIVELKGR